MIYLMRDYDKIKPETSRAKFTKASIESVA